jgi:hypothetical protein
MGYISAECSSRKRLWKEGFADVFASFKGAENSPNNETFAFFVLDSLLMTVQHKASSP